MLTPREKSLLPEKFSSEEDRTHDVVSSRTASPTHDQRANRAPFAETISNQGKKSNKQTRVCPGTASVRACERLARLLGARVSVQLEQLGIREIGCASRAERFGMKPSFSLGTKAHLCFVHFTYRSSEQVLLIALCCCCCFMYVVLWS